jgi:hypothetical protein
MDFFRKAKLWELLWLAAFPILIALVILGQVYGLPKLLVGFVFALVPIDFGVGLIVIDMVRGR